MVRYNQPQPEEGTRPLVVQGVQPQIVAISPNFGPQQQRCICPHCRSSIQTTVKTKATKTTHFTALLLCIFLCWPCVCLPYCMDSCNSINHYCPNCDAYLGNYQG